MASLMTRGFTTSGLTGQHTPVDPRFAVADPTAMFRGIQGGMKMLQDIENDALLRQDRPRQQLLRDIELAKAQAELDSVPGRARLLDMQLAEADRKFRIGALEPIEQGKPVREIDASGNLIEFQPTLDFNPVTGRPYDVGTKPAMDTSLIKSAQQMESEQRAMEALAQKNVATGEAALIRATTPRTNAPRIVNDYANNRVLVVTMNPDGTQTATPVIDEQGREAAPPPRSATGGGGLEDMFGGTPAPTTVTPAPTKITGTQAPANAVPGIDTPFNLNIPKGSFPTIDAANAAVANGSLQVKPRDIVLINGVPLKWVDGP